MKAVVKIVLMTIAFVTPAGQFAEAQHLGWCRGVSNPHQNSACVAPSSDGKPVNQAPVATPTSTETGKLPQTPARIAVPGSDQATPAQEPQQVPTPVPQATPTQVPIQVPTPTPQATPAQVPVQVPTAIPQATPAQVPTPIPQATPAQVPVQVPTPIPQATPAQVPVQVPTPIPQATPAQVPVQVPPPIPQVTPAQAPVPTPIPQVTPAQVPMKVPPAIPQATSTPVPARVPTPVPQATPTRVPVLVRPTPIPGGQIVSTPTTDSRTGHDVMPPWMARPITTDPGRQAAHALPTYETADGQRAQCIASGFGWRYVRKSDGSMALVGRIPILRVTDQVVQEIPANQLMSPDCVVAVQRRFAQESVPDRSASRARQP